MNSKINKENKSMEESSKIANVMQFKQEPETIVQITHEIQ
jgi:hypothetical protein